MKNLDTIWAHEAEVRDLLRKAEAEPSRPVNLPFEKPMTKREMIKALESACIASGHTKARAKQLAKEHYKRFKSTMGGAE